MSPPIPADGFLDLHCHILPGIDDGCREVSESLACVRQWIAAGYRGAVCTPHVCTTWFPENNPAKIAAWVTALQAVINDAGLTFDLWPGGEVRLGARTVDWFGEFGVPTVGPGKCVLIDWWGTDWPICCDGTIEYLLKA
ncbi:MAG TPA: CpsB/CapC family capsule biosynthesis tyrosine phosphatase, partial [Pirellulaceae bacterium]|nr:CpsB/CapC family capsule biosynthesis tyrosine phosphatase [Pirellulaceae bacterium]